VQYSTASARIRRHAVPQWPARLAGVHLLIGEAQQGSRVGAVRASGHSDRSRDRADPFDLDRESGAEAPGDDVGGAAFEDRDELIAAAFLQKPFTPRQLAERVRIELDT
jgi:hypothetical protein